MSEAADVVYHVDARDELVFVNPQWDRFASENDGQAFLSHLVLGRPLWDFIADITTRQLYRDMLARVRAGRALTFPLRCDSPDMRRSLSMRATPLDARAVAFTVRTLETQPRPGVRLLAAEGERRGAPLRMCGWCRKVDVEGAWLEIEDAVARLGLFDAPQPPLTHGICADCEAQLDRTIGAP
ncbi:MAG: hypothetical protein SF051_06600 [Elusimicrobiota bacterium]|nr:hypothetical protein [Elusimicrobiota bacterium]